MAVKIALMAAQDDKGGIMKHSNTDEGISGRKKVGRMKSAWVWMAVGLVVAVMAGGCIGEKKIVDREPIITDFFRGNFSISGTPSLNQNANKGEIKYEM